MLIWNFFKKRKTTNLKQLFLEKKENKSKANYKKNASAEIF